MARTHGRIQAAIWSDGDFIAMRGTAQRMFMFLLSQPDLSHAGLLPMRVRRWATKAEDATPKGVRDELDYLAERDFVVVDEDTEEVLIRTMVRNDGVYKQPKVMLRLREDAKQIESPLLRAAFRAELERLPLDELSTMRTGRDGDGPSTREAVQGVVNALLGDFEADAGYPSEGVSDTPHVRAGALHQPPTTVPLPPSTGHRDKPLLDKPSEMDRFDEFWDTYDKKVNRKAAEAKWRLALKRVGVTPDLLIAAAGSYVTYERTQNQGGRFVMDPAKWLNGHRWEDERSGRERPPEQHQSRASQWLQLAADMGEPEPPTNLRQIGPRR